MTPGKMCFCANEYNSALLGNMNLYLGGARVLGVFRKSRGCTPSPACGWESSTQNSIITDLVNTVLSSPRVQSTSQCQQFLKISFSEILIFFFELKLPSVHKEEV